MLLADRIAQCRRPFVVRSGTTGVVDWLSGPMEAAEALRECACRYVLSDELVRLCTRLAYSSPAGGLTFDERLHVPAERVWVEWCESAWRAELARTGFDTPEPQALGRRGALVRASRDGRSGTLRTFWSTEAESALREGAPTDAVLASSMESYFDLDVDGQAEPLPPDGNVRAAIALRLHAEAGEDALRRCVRLRFEQSWARYYARAALGPAERQALVRHALGTIALDIPVLFTFFLLLGTRVGLPQRSLSRTRLNRARLAAGRPPLLDHIEVCCPIAPPVPAGSVGAPGAAGRRPPRLHHVRGHLVRRGGRVFWRLPHLRGSPRAGAVRTRTVTWTAEPSPPGAMPTP